MDSFKEAFRSSVASASNNLKKATRKKFPGQGHSLGGASEPSGKQDAHRNPQERPGAAAAAAQSRARPAAPAAAPRPSRPLGFADPPATQPTAASTSAEPTLGTSAAVRAAVTPVVTDEMNIATAMIVSGGDSSDMAVKTLCKLLANILKSPDEPKFRLLRKANERIGATLAAPGSTELLLSVGFHASEDGAALQLPDTDDLAHVAGALQLLTEHCTPAYATAASSPGQGSPQNGAATHDAPQATPKEPTAVGTSSTAAAKAPALEQAANQNSSTGAQAQASSHQTLGISPEQWQSQNKGKTSINIGGAAVSASKPVASSQQPLAAAAVPPPEPEQFTGRNTKVLLPMAPEIEVADEVFKRTPAELRRDMQLARQKREQQETLMTRAMREKLKPPRRQPRFARVRVRFPEGVALQGDFEPQEPVQNVFLWVEEHLALREPFNLASPALTSKDRKLGAAGTVREAGLMPTFALTFSWADKALTSTRQLCLSEAALQLLQAED